LWNQNKNLGRKETPNPEDGKLELLTDRNSALVLVDYQPIPTRHRRSDLPGR